MFTSSHFRMHWAMSAVVMVVIAPSNPANFSATGRPAWQTQLISTTFGWTLRFSDCIPPCPKKLLCVSCFMLRASPRFRSIESATFVVYADRPHTMHMLVVPVMRRGLDSALQVACMKEVDRCGSNLCGGGGAGDGGWMKVVTQGHNVIAGHTCCQKSCMKNGLYLSSSRRRSYSRSLRTRSKYSSISR